MSDVDVIVVGAGGAGMATAYFAAANGLSTLVLERAQVLGGTTAYSGGGLWLPACAPHERAGVADSTQAAREYLNALLGDYRTEIREAFLTTAPVAMAALEQNPDLPFQHQAFPDYFDAPGRVEAGRALHPLDIKADELGERADLVRPSIDDDWYATGKRSRRISGGRALIARLLKAFDATGNGRVITGARVRDLIVTDGAVTGVVAVTADGETRYTATKAVILGAGGFEGSQEMRDAAGTPGKARWTLGPRGTNEGEPIAAAERAGAATDLMDQAWWCPGIVNADGTACFSLGFRSGFFVDGDGNRFGNESLPYDQMGRVLQEKDNRIPSWFVYDSREGGGLPAIALPTPDPAACLDAGVWVKADTLDELAGKIGVPASALAATAQRFNEFAAAGADADHHRGEDVFDSFFVFDKEAAPNPAVVPLNQPPYYAAKLVLGDLGTKGGLVTDADARVLDGDGKAILGLYAVGNTAAAWSKDRYPGPGTPIGTGVVFGYRAVQSLI